VLALNKTFNFKGFNDVMDFIQGVADISREEKARVKSPHDILQEN
jgi:pterin-4a-carbinolamine dehydratase